MLYSINFSRLLAPLGLAVLLSLAVASCATLPTPTPQPTATPQPTPTPQPVAGPVDSQELRSLVQEAVKEAMLSVPEAPAQTPAPVSPVEIERIVAAAVAATPTIGREEVELLIAQSLSEALGSLPEAIGAARVQELVSQELDRRFPEIGPDTPRPQAPKETIVFSALPWNSADIQNRIAMFIVEHGYGYPVDTIQGNTQSLWNALVNGNSHVTMEVWLPNQQKDWEKAIRQASVIPLGTSLDDNWQSGFVVPSYIVDRANQLETVADLPDNQQVLSTAIGQQKIPLITCPNGSECQDINAAKLIAYGLDNIVQPVVPESFRALEEGLERAYANEEPWLGYVWGPSPLADRLDLTVLREPPYSEECWAADKGCAYPTAQVLIAAHPSLVKRAPEVVEFLRNWDFNTRRQVNVDTWMARNDATPGEASLWFLNTQGTAWTPWVPENVAAKIKKALAEN